jgi:dipeptidyl aminopeptidase/acylaminoacyl peptidase
MYRRLIASLTLALGLTLSGAALAQFPSTDVLLVDLPDLEGAPHVVAADAVTFISDDEGYDNQPSFTPDGEAILYVSQVDDQTEIYRYLLVSGESERVTETPESEFSPAVTPDGDHITAVRIEADGVTQRLWRFDLEGENAEPYPEEVYRTGYYAFANPTTVVFFIVGEGEDGQPFTLEVVDTETGEVEVVSENIGTSIQKVPDREAVSYVQRQDDDSAVITVLDVETGEMQGLVEPLPGVDAHAWMPDGTLLMAQDDTIYSWQEGQDGWQPFMDFSEAGVSGIGRLAVSPDGSRLAFVINR